MCIALSVTCRASWGTAQRICLTYVGWRPRKTKRMTELAPDLQHTVLFDEASLLRSRFLLDSAWFPSQMPRRFLSLVMSKKSVLCSSFKVRCYHCIPVCFWCKLFVSHFPKLLYRWQIRAFLVACLNRSSCRFERNFLHEIAQNEIVYWGGFTSFTLMSAHICWIIHLK